MNPQFLTVRLMFLTQEADEQGRFVTETLAEIYFNQEYLIKQ